METDPRQIEETLAALTPQPAQVMYTMRTAETVRVPDNLSPEEVRLLLGSAFFNRNALLILQIETVTNPIAISPVEFTMLGRATESDLDVLLIDLTPYDAFGTGVSRLHAALHRNEHTLAIEDWDSSNGTYVNGGRLPPHQAQTLHDGDILRLGKLQMRIAFQYG